MYLNAPNLEVLNYLLLFSTFLSTWHKVESSEKRESQVRKHFHDISLQECLCGISLINDWSGGDQSMMGGVIFGQVVLECVK